MKDEKKWLRQNKKCVDSFSFVFSFKNVRDGSGNIKCAQYQV